MHLNDSNIIIYSTTSEYPGIMEIVLSDEAYVSDITRLEVLGFHNISKNSMRYFSISSSI